MEPSSLTVVLEPTDLRVAVLILRNPHTYLEPSMVYLIFFFLFHLGDCIVFLSFCLLRRNIPIVSFLLGRVLSASSQLDQKERDGGTIFF